MINLNYVTYYNKDYFLFGIFSPGVSSKIVKLDLRIYNDCNFISSAWFPEPSGPVFSRSFICLLIRSNRPLSSFGDFFLPSRGRAVFEWSKAVLILISHCAWLKDKSLSVRTWILYRAGSSEIKILSFGSFKRVLAGPGGMAAIFSCRFLNTPGSFTYDVISVFVRPMKKIKRMTSVIARLKRGFLFCI